MRNNSRCVAAGVTPSTKDEVEACYPSLTANGDVYKTFVEHVKGVFSTAVADCYGRFVLLTEPIVSQPTINRLVALFKSKFQDQYWAIASLLNYTVHMKRF